MMEEAFWTYFHFLVSLGEKMLRLVADHIGAFHFDKEQIQDGIMVDLQGRLPRGRVPASPKNCRPVHYVFPMILSTSILLDSLVLMYRAQFQMDSPLLENVYLRKLFLKQFQVQGEVIIFISLTMILMVYSLFYFAPPSTDNYHIYAVVYHETGSTKLVFNNHGK